MTVLETSEILTWHDLRRRVHGRLTTPDRPEYAAARMPWTLNVDQRPAAVLEVAHAEDVVTAVRWAAANGVSVSAQPTGHAPRRTLDGTLLLRTRALRALSVDTHRRTATVGAGVKWGELLAALDGTELMALAGSNPDPTVVGLALGGGAGWFTRRHGFTANSVVSFDVVDATGQRRQVSRASDPELFWALRGGGGDFAIVLGLELALFEATAMYGGQLLWPVEHTPAVLRAFRDVALSAPPELTVWAHVMHFPPIPDVPEPLRGRSFVTVATTFLGRAGEAEALLAPIRAAAPAEMDTLMPIQPSQLGSVTNEPTDPMPGLEHSALLTSLDDAAIDRLSAVVTDSQTCPLMMVQLRGLGGAFADDGHAGGAVRPVGEPFQLLAVGVPAVPELAKTITFAFDAIDTALEDLMSEHRMPNFVGIGQSDATGYDAERLARLRAIKLGRDPGSVIRSNKPVMGE